MKYFCYLSTRKVSFVVLLLGGLLIPLCGFSQIQVSGKVVDVQGEPLAGVSVVVKGTQTGTPTNFEGSYTITVPSEKSVLRFSYLGFVSTEVLVGNQQHTKVVVLREDAINLDEHVVIGYGSMRKSDLTGAVGVVDVSDLQQAPVKSFDEALAGRIAGVQVVSAEGKPGSSIDVIIRGGNSVTQSNSPLYVIDGFPIEDPGNEDANPINSIDPEDIASLTILKDASATAIYGARAANGVVVITTKRGSDGKTIIKYNGYYGWQQSNKRLDVLSPYEYVRLQQEMNPASTETYYLMKDTPDGPVNVGLDYYRDMQGINWEDQVMRTAPINNQHISLSGGNKTSQYNASLSYLNQEGIIVHSGYKRLQGRLGLDHQANKRLKISLNTSYSNADSYGTQTSSSNYNNELNLLFSVWAYRPISFINSNISLIELPQDPEVEPAADFRYNPIITTENELRENRYVNFSANGYLEYAILDNLKFKLSGGYTSYKSENDSFNNSLSRFGNPSTNNKVNGGRTYSSSDTWLNENTLTYDMKFNDDHVLNALAGFSLQENKNDRFGAYAKLLPNEVLGISGLDEGTPNSIVSSSSDWRLVSFLARANYTFKSKYLFTASYRRDGSSRFAKGHKWGDFVSGAFAWRLGSEEFIKQFEFISDAKVRLSWGITGNNNVGNYSYMPGYTTPLNGGYSPGGDYNNGSYPNVMGNPDLKWETTEQADFGVDLGFFKQRLRFSLDLYRKNTRDLLLNASLPPSTGYASQFENIGKVRNEGIELSITGVPVESKNFRWVSTFNIGFNRNRVLELAQNEYSLQSAVGWGDDWKTISAYIARVGQPVAAIYGHIWDGVYQVADFDKVGSVYVLKDNVPSNGMPRESIQPGHIKYRDLNGDKVIDDNDRTVIGNPLPVHTGGFTNKFAYKGFDLNIFFQWSYGNDVYNANRVMLESGYKYNTNQFASYANRWSFDNQTSDIPVPKGSMYKTYSTRTVEDASYLRLKTVSLGYNLPKKITRKASMEAVRVYVSAQNLYTWTSYSGYDPEVSVRRSALTPGFDYSAYPRAKTATVGLNITF